MDPAVVQSSACDLLCNDRVLGCTQFVERACFSQCRARARAGRGSLAHSSHWCPLSWPRLPKTCRVKAGGRWLIAASEKNDDITNRFLPYFAAPRLFPPYLATTPIFHFFPPLYHCLRAMFSKRTTRKLDFDWNDFLVVNAFPETSLLCVCGLSL